MRYFILIAAAIFSVTNLWAWIARLKTDNPLVQPMSAYLTGKDSAAVDIGYFSLAMGMLAMAFTNVHNYGWVILLAIGAAALATVTETKRLQIGTDPKRYATLESIHVASAGLAFTCLTASEIVFYFPMFPGIPVFLPLLAVTIAAGFAIFKRTETAILERIYTSLLLAWVFTTFA